jgi:flagellar motor switch protein FliG
MSDSQTNLRKAAVLVACLDRPSAERLLAALAADEAQAVRDALSMLGSVTDGERSAVLDEFYSAGPFRKANDLGGVELDDSLARRLEISAERNSSEPNSSADGKPAFHFLHDAPGELLSPRLAREHPQTVAVVLSHLPPERSAEVLSWLPAEVQTDVVGRLARLDETDPAIVREIEQGLEAWFSQHASWRPRRTAGLKTLEGILAAAEPATRKRLLETVERQGVAMPDSDRPRRQIGATFDDLLTLDDESLGEVLRGADAEVVVLALAGAEQSLVERVHAQLPMEAAKMLRYGLDHLGPTRLSDVEEAQRQLAALAHDLLLKQHASRNASRRLSLAA